MKIVQLLSVLAVMLRLRGGQTDADRPLVQTRSGWLRGCNTTTRGGRQVYEFLGIPYAQPPTGSLRFKGFNEIYTNTTQLGSEHARPGGSGTSYWDKLLMIKEPVAVTGWDGVKDATSECSACIQQFTAIESTQHIVSGAEDCLCLNVFTPQLTPDERLPVIVYFHPGTFMGLSSDKALFGPSLLLDQDVILVTLNYRVGIMGFATTTDGTISGNAGMKDQALALRWVNENIERFGGDLSCITLMGESAGAASAHLHMYSPLSQDLFTRAITHSGSAFLPWLITDSKVLAERTSLMAEQVGCPSSNSLAMLLCLQQVPAVDIVNKTQKQIVWDVDPVTLWGPTVEAFDKEGAFLTKHPRESNQHLTIPLLAGFNNAEGAYKTYTLTSGDVEGKFKKWNEDFDSITATSLQYDNTAQYPAEVSQAIRQYYFGDDVTQIEPSMTAQITKLYSDRWFINGAVETVERHEGPIFLYYLNRNTSLSIIGTAFTGSKEYYGVCHADDLMYFFPMYDIAATIQKLDPGYLEVSQQLIELWTMFAKHGNPSNENLVWEAADQESTRNLEINKDGMVMKSSIPLDIIERVNFWKTLLIRN